MCGPVNVSLRFLKTVEPGAESNHLWPLTKLHRRELMARDLPAQFSAYFRHPSECASVRQPKVFVSTLGCSRESCLALLESLPKPNKQQHAAQRHKEWNQLSHRPPPDLQVQHYSGCIFERCAISVPALKKTYKIHKRSTVVREVASASPLGSEVRPARGHQGWTLQTEERGPASLFLPDSAAPYGDLEFSVPACHVTSYYGRRSPPVSH